MWNRKSAYSLPCLLLSNTLNPFQEERTYATEPIGRLDHIAFAVHSIDQARTFLKARLAPSFAT